MRKVALGLIAVVLCLLFLNLSLSAQTLDEKEKLYQEYLKKKVKSEEGDIPKYTTPEIYEETEPVVEVKKETKVSIPTPVAHGTPGIPKASPQELQPFGYNMFNLSPSSFAPIAPTSVPPDYTL